MKRKYFETYTFVSRNRGGGYVPTSQGADESSGGHRWILEMQDEGKWRGNVKDFIGGFFRV